jgi:hypothetical protein
MPDPTPTAVIYTLAVLGLLTLARWALGDIGEFIRWFRKWRNDLKS